MRGTHYDGTALPCHAARMLPGLTFPNVKAASVEWIWRDSPAFQAYRGDVGGPIYIPKIYDGHNRTFFFFNYEEYLETTYVGIA